MYKFFRFLKSTIDLIFYDERIAGPVRFLFFISLSSVIILIGYNLFENVDTTTIEESYQILYENNPVVRIMRVALTRSSRYFIYGFRHSIIPISVFIGVLVASAFYVQDVYELPKLSLAFRYIWAAFTGIIFPKLTIKDGESVIKKGKVNLIDTIGGPGYVNIRPGNVVLFESLRSPSSVRPNGLHFISRFETIKEIVSLDDQHGFIEETKSKTRDGISLVVRDVHFRYRLRTGRRFGDYEQRKATNPFMYSVQAVKNMAYNRSVSGTGLSDWHTSVRSAVDGAITEYIKANKFDQLTAPNYEDADPRAEISKMMMGTGVRARLRSMGAELLWFDIGHFDVIEKIDDELEIKRIIEAQRIDTWSARWDGDAMIIKAAGEGKRMSYEEVGRAEGQAEILNSILQALEEISADSGVEQRSERVQKLRSIVWMRIAQVFDRIAEEEKKQDSSDRLPSGPQK